MVEASFEELEESIKDLTSYKERLVNEVAGAAQRLNMPKEKYESTIKDHGELKKINKVLSQLIAERERRQLLD